MRELKPPARDPAPGTLAGSPAGSEAGVLSSPHVLVLVIFPPFGNDPLLHGSAVTLPEGTVTVLSTDLVGSMLLNQRLGDDAATTLEREVADLARVQVEKQRGVVITSDRDHEPVGAYFEVTTHLSPQYDLLWNFDLFQDAVTAALDDP
jgi:hypothetical protein